jgi:hypothetical protein
MINPIDREDLRERVRNATPFPFFYIDSFLDPAFAARVHDALPTFEEAGKIGLAFTTPSTREERSRLPTQPTSPSRSPS